MALLLFIGGSISLIKFLIKARRLSALFSCAKKGLYATIKSAVSVKIRAEYDARTPGNRRLSGVMTPCRKLAARPVAALNDGSFKVLTGLILEATFIAHIDFMAVHSIGGEF